MKKLVIIWYLGKKKIRDLGKNKIPAKQYMLRKVQNLIDRLSNRKFVKYQQKSKERSGGKANNSTSVQIQTRPLFKPSEFLDLPTGSCVLLNPHFRKGKNAYIPLLASIKLRKDYQENINCSKKCWSEIKQKLIEQSPDKLINNKEREALDYEVEKIFSQLKQKKKNGWDKNKNYNQEKKKFM